jgi:ribosome-associated protein
MQSDEIKHVVLDALEELKAVDIKVLDLRKISSFTDVMIIASGTSTRQIRALSESIIEKCKETGVRPLGIEGEREARWILVDLGDVVVHLMHPETRLFYNLEKLWSVQENGSVSAVS